MKKLDDVRAWLAQQKQPAEMRVGVIEKKPGYSVLFDGPATSDKIEAAKMLAKEFGKEVEHVNVSKVVRKYIGETEKNIASVFIKAKEKDRILFFDEADALFGKRTDVKEAHDRFANLEISYLLQKIEAHSGLAILATHLQDNLNDSLIRRFRSVVHFENE